MKLSKVLLIIGILLISISVAHKLLYARSIRLSDSLLSNASYTTRQNRASRIRIAPNINLPIVEAGYINGSWLISEKNANHVASSASPGDRGNIIIYAHNKIEMFGPLLWLTMGNDIELTTSTGNIHRYKIVKIAEVNVKDTSLLKPTPNEVVTLYTCSGFLDSKRWIIRAVPNIR